MPLKRKEDVVETTRLVEINIVHNTNKTTYSISGYFDTVGELLEWLRENMEDTDWLWTIK